MNFLRTMLIVCAVVVLACSALKNQQQRRALDEGPALKSVHFFNLPPDITESQYISAFSETNKVISELGYPDTGYRLWKVQRDYDAEYKYTLIGNWPSQAAYDVIHENEAYKNAVERLQAKLLVEKDLEQVYLRYSEVTTVVNTR